MVEPILYHRKIGRGYQFLTLTKGSLESDAEWQPARHFIDADGTMNDNFLDYIKSNNIMKENWPYENSVVRDDHRKREAIV